MSDKEAITELNKLTGWNAKDLAEAVRHVGIKIASERSRRYDSEEEVERLRELLSKSDL